MIISRKALDTYPNITKNFLQNLSFLVKKSMSGNSVQNQNKQNGITR